MVEEALHLERMRQRHATREGYAALRAEMRAAAAAAAGAAANGSVKRRRSGQGTGRPSATLAGVAGGEGGEGDSDEAGGDEAGEAGGGEGGEEGEEGGEGGKGDEGGAEGAAVGDEALGEALAAAWGRFAALLFSAAGVPAGRALAGEPQWLALAGGDLTGGALACEAVLPAEALAEATASVLRVAAEAQERAVASAVSAARLEWKRRSEADLQVCTQL